MKIKADNRIIIYEEQSRFSP